MSCSPQDYQTVGLINVAPRPMELYNRVFKQQLHGTSNDVNDKYLQSEVVSRFPSRWKIQFLICLFVLTSFPLGMSLIYCRSIKSRRQVRKLPEPKQKAYIQKMSRVNALILKIDTHRLGRRMTAVTVFVTIWHKMVIALVIMLFLD